MSETDDLERIERAARELIPALTARLAESGLGEIEVRHDEVRVRVVSGTSVPPAQPAAVQGGQAPAASPAGSAAGQQPLGPGSGEPAGAGPRRHPVPSPAVGFFVYADGLGPGQEVTKGDALGWVEMLGVRHDVRAPRSGTVRGLPAESGEAVEYGQPLVEMEERVP